ncbi:MAG: anaerobic ribonucleoside-triphosphate reductase activating protein [Atribacterota bacterium]|nr:anaerobic ribonucleoside-triphosphate reductase activating protein [Atribacterota bacterium]
MISLIFRGWYKTSYIEYPGKLSTVLFVAGCNFRCPFCHNPELVEEWEILPRVSEEEVLSHLEKRRGLLDAVVITGGEPLLQKNLLSFVRTIKEKGYLLKIDSNGSSWEAFTSLREYVDQWGIDYKLPFSEYHRVGGEKWARTSQRVLEALLATPGRLEVRTTIFPPFHSLETLLRMGESVTEASSWWWQNFRPEKTLAPEAKSISPYPLSVLQEWQTEINEKLGKNLVRIRPG